MNAIFEPGLPASGPSPVHLHAGHPTPWSEGCAVRFVPETHSAWVGNLQRGYGYAKKAILWPEARAVIVIAKGASYFVRPDQPRDWEFLDLLGIDCVLSPDRTLALLSTYTDVVAVTSEGRIAWRTSVAVDGVTIERFESGRIIGQAGIDPPDEWHTFVLDLKTGTKKAEPGATDNPGDAQ